MYFCALSSTVSIDGVVKMPLQASIFTPGRIIYCIDNYCIGGMMVNRPHIVCHMVMSIDGKVTGDFLYRPECEKATDIYYEINRNYKAEGFICGRLLWKEALQMAGILTLHNTNQ